MADAPPATLLEVCWHIRTPNGKVVTCAVYRDAAPGLDVRAQFSQDDLLRSQPASLNAAFLQHLPNRSEPG